ncbi:MAG: hypothetical protein K6F35_08585 [Lachnospiraceae bacterium]|nr:hypothetical protein [Lachnospiraceae bacterium]
MRKRNELMKQFMALVMTAALAAVQVPMPVYAGEIPQEASTQAVGAGEISVPESVEEPAGEISIPESVEEPAGDGEAIEAVSWNGLQEAFNNASVNEESPTDDHAVGGFKRVCAT